jgi:hypothetical protein
MTVGSEFISDNQERRLKEEKMISGLTRTERLDYRNEKILQDLATGKTKRELQEEYRIGERRLEQIIKEAEDDSSVWYRELTKTHAIALHNINLKKYLQCIIELENLRKNVDRNDIRLQADITMNIGKMRKDYDGLIADGALFRRVKEMEELIES